MIEISQLIVILAFSAPFLLVYFAYAFFGKTMRRRKRRQIKRFLDLSN